jgi:hypothetical protein
LYLLYIIRIYFEESFKINRESACRGYHERPTAGHVDQEATYLKIAEKYYWAQNEQMDKEVCGFLSSSPKTKKISSKTY